MTMFSMSGMIGEATGASPRLHLGQAFYRTTYGCHLCQVQGEDKACVEQLEPLGRGIRRPEDTTVVAEACPPTRQSGAEQAGGSKAVKHKWRKPDGLQQS